MSEMASMRERFVIGNISGTDAENTIVFYCRERA
jgi:hypothetical protein